MKDFKYISKIDIPFEIVSYSTSKSIKIYMKNGYIKITKPKWYPQKKILKYIEENTQNIINQYEKHMKRIKSNSLLEQDYLYLLGDKHEFKIIQHNSSMYQIYIQDNVVNVKIPAEILISQKEIIISKLINQLYRDYTFDLVKRGLDKYCRIMKINMPNFRIKECKTIWGSCSSKGNLSFNIKLAMLPPNVIEQIIIHELCHLRHMNHGKEFWNAVYSYCTKEQYALSKKWIRDNVRLN